MRLTIHRPSFALLLLIGGACASPRGAARAVAPLAPAALRVYHSGASRFVPFDSLVAATSRADVVFFGEQHDDSETHFAEFALADALGLAGRNVVVSMEMFERDVQPVLDGYIAGHISEFEFLSKARPWERYATDYRPIVQLARARGWRVIAANVPRTLASAVSRKGRAALDSVGSAQRPWIARELQCPRDNYYTRFAQEMKGHSAGGPASATDTAGLGAMTERFYDAQCLKDETMAESIADAFSKAPRGSVVVHYDGAFHSDFAEGTVARALRRMPNARVLVISAVPVADPGVAKPDSVKARGDYIIFTRKPAAH